MVEQLAKPLGEVALYHDFALRIWSGQLPYKDFFPEYPPFSLFFFSLAQSLGTKWFNLLWLAELGIAILLTAMIVKKLRGNPYIYLAVIFPLASLVWERFDIFPALLSIFALYLGVKKRFYWGSFILAIAFLTKIYPIVLFPLFIYWQYQNDDLVKVSKSLGIFVLTVVVTLLMIISYGGGAGLKRFIEFQSKRGIEIESIRALPFLIEKKGIVEYKNNTYEIR